MDPPYPFYNGSGPPQLTDAEWLNENGASLAWGEWTAKYASNRSGRVVDPKRPGLWLKVLEADVKVLNRYVGGLATDPIFMPLHAYWIIDLAQSEYHDTFPLGEIGPISFYANLRWDIIEWVIGSIPDYQTYPPTHPLVLQLDLLIRPIVLFCLKHHNLYSRTEGDGQDIFRAELNL